MRPVVELKQEPDGRLSLSSKSTFKNASITFNLNEEFDEETLDGRKVKSLITLEGNKLIQVQKNGKETLTIREFTPEEMKIVRNRLFYIFHEAFFRNKSTSNLANEFLVKYISKNNFF